MVLRSPRPTLFPYTTLFRSMQEPFTRDRIIEVLKTMPADATVDDAIERLVFLAKIESGLAELDRDRKSTRLNSSHEWRSYSGLCWNHNRCATSAPSATTSPK